MSKMMRKVKRENIETASGSKAPAVSSIDDVEQDLTYYIEDRVELMKQVFSILKPKELQAMASECSIGLDMDELQELCLEEVLGISSKRLCAVLDGADPPSDTESSSDNSEKKSDRLDVISLDSISSDDDLSTHSHKRTRKKKKHTQCHRKRELEMQNQSQKHDKKKKTQTKMAEVEMSARDNVSKDDVCAAKKAGMTILELLELQARARAIRAQLALENNVKDDGEADGFKDKSSSSSDSEVQIKEEPQEVVEIESSEEDVKNVLPEQRKKRDKESKHIKPVLPAPVPERDLTIIVPQKQVTQKVKLKRTKAARPIVQVAVETLKIEDEKERNGTKNERPEENTLEKSNKRDVEKDDNSKNDVTNKSDAIVKGDNLENKTETEVDKSYKNTKRKYRTHKKKVRKNSDHDELELELSDTEKMDLLENFRPENYDDVTTSGSDSGDSSRESDLRNVIELAKAKKNVETKSVLEGSNKKKFVIDATESNKVMLEVTEDPIITDIIDRTDSVNKEIEVTDKIDVQTDVKTADDVGGNVSVKDETRNVSEKEQSVSKERDVLDEEQPVPDMERNVLEREQLVAKKQPDSTEKQDLADEGQSITEREQQVSKREQSVLIQLSSDISAIQIPSSLKASSSTSDKEATNKSDGELTDRSSSDVEMYDKPPEVISISDDELAKAGMIAKRSKLHRKSKKSKEKKHKKKSKKSKKLDFREGADQNFFDKNGSDPEEGSNEMIINKKSTEYSSRSAHIVTDIITIDIDNDTSENTDRNVFSDRNRKKCNDSLGTTDSIDIVVEDIENDSSEGAVPNTTDIIEDLDKISIIDSENSDDIYCVSDSDEFNQIFEISDDSELSESEEYSVLSKEPTSDEIEAFSIKIEHEIACENMAMASNALGKSTEVVSKDNLTEDVEGVSWKDRWLESKSVKKVLATSNILNAIRKKNIELKKKLAESKIVSSENEENFNEKSVSESEKLELPKEIATEESNGIGKHVEGSIEHYNMLQGSTKYVDPIQEPQIEKNNVDVAMKRDAKQIMKMYKRLLKISKKKNREKNRDKKKQKKSKNKKDVDILTAVSVENGIIDNRSPVAEKQNMNVQILKDLNVENVSIDNIGTQGTLSDNPSSSMNDKPNINNDSEQQNIIEESSENDGVIL